ncbi:MAG: SDR family oxidoreductase [Paracoccaceae bacterium]|nr:SDR family oxidoreductase [Paracoccaceae bacterium]
MRTILIIGGGGMVGQKLAHLLADQPLAAGDRITLCDLQFPENGAPVAEEIRGTVTNPGVMKRLAAQRPEIVYYLAAIVSGEAEADFELGWSVNMDAFRVFLDTFRAEVEASNGSYKPQIIFTSSIAVFGAPFPEKIDDEFLHAPQTSYGAQKAMSELVLSDHIRKGFFDGVSIRLPTICVRPGKPNKAASSFFSGIIREPLNGQDAVLPVSPETRHWHASPRSAAGFLRHAATLRQDLYQGRPALNMPGVSCTVIEQIEALKDIAGGDVTARIQYAPDPVIEDIVKYWPRDFAPERATALGFTAEKDFAEIIQVYLDDDFQG